MSLLKDLKPEVKALLDVDKKSYPTLVGTIEKELSSNHSVQDITVGTANSLVD